MNGPGPAVLVKRGQIEGHVRPQGGLFSRAALLPPFLSAAATPFFGVHCVDTTERVIALTYDDGPHPEHTPRILDELAGHDVTATFFVLGPAARARPDIVRRIVGEGHTVALHGDDHRSLLTRRSREATASIARAKDELEQIAGTAVTLYRPPYGHHTILQASMIRRLGLELIIWSSDGLDWVDDEVENIADRAMAAVFSGAILLLHDDRADPDSLLAGERLPAFDKALLTRRILERSRAEGFTLCTVDHLLARFPRVVSGSRERMVRR